MINFSIITLAPLDRACHQAKNQNSLELLCYTGGTVVPPQILLLHVQSLVDFTATTSWGVSSDDSLSVGAS